jgi:hypothetical protein
MIGASSAETSFAAGLVEGFVAGVVEEDAP